MTTNWLYEHYLKAPITMPVDEHQPIEPVDVDPVIPDVIEPVVVHDRVHEAIDKFHELEHGAIDKIHEWEHKAHLDENGPFIVFILAICLVVWLIFHKTQNQEK